MRLIAKTLYSNLQAGSAALRAHAQSLLEYQTIPDPFFLPRRKELIEICSCTKTDAKPTPADAGPTQQPDRREPWQELVWTLVGRAAGPRAARAAGLPSTANANALACSCGPSLGAALVWCRRSGDAHSALTRSSEHVQAARAGHKPLGGSWEVPLRFRV